MGFLCRGAGAEPLHPRDWPAVSGAALSALTRTGRCKKVYGSYRKISLIHKGFLDCKPSCATARVRGLSPLRHRPPFALCEGGFAPFTPAIEETQLAVTPKFDSFFTIKRAREISVILSGPFYDKKLSSLPFCHPLFLSQNQQKGFGRQPRPSPPRGGGGQERSIGCMRRKKPNSHGY